jgi:diguanylate cyclase (GGDEF)-like protein
VVIIRRRNNIDRQYCGALLFFVIPPSICAVIQTFIYGTSLIYNGMVLSLFIVFLNIQNRSMHVDYLTGANNRKKLDLYLKDKIISSDKDNAFSLIIMDINNFKAINDNFGHAIGDDALEVFVRLLKNCLRSTDFIARYGGDEFVAILDVSNMNDLLATIGRINEYFENFNKKNSRQYKLELSMGYDVYDIKSKMTAEEFIKHVDMLMYENKMKKKESDK